MFVETENVNQTIHNKGQFKYIFLAILPEESAPLGNTDMMKDSYLWLD